jgi:hypothetical protein
MKREMRGLLIFLAFVFVVGVCEVLYISFRPKVEDLFMSRSTALTAEEKQNGKRKLLIPSEEIQELMRPVMYDDFAKLVRKAIPPSPQDETAEK